MKKPLRNARIGNGRLPDWLDQVRSRLEHIAVTAELMRGYAEADGMNAATVAHAGRMILLDAEAVASLLDKLERHRLNQNQRP